MMILQLDGRPMQFGCAKNANMSKWLSLFLSFLLAFFTNWSPNQAISQDRATIESVKEVCFLAEVSGKEQKHATAFCVHPIGIVVTNHHVVDQIDLGGTIKLIANSGQPNQETLEAKLLRIDEKNDLAILKINKAGTYKAIEIANSPDLYETLGVIAFGFPFGKSLSLEEDAFPTISVNSGKITAIRKDKTEAQLLQLDATLNPGNSGGPVIDNSGKLIGVVSFGVAGAGVNFAIPSEKLRGLLEKPDLQLNVPEITSANFTIPKDVEVTVTPLIEEIADPTVEFWIKRGEAPAKKFTLSAQGPNKYAGKVFGEAEKDKKFVRGEIEFKQGKIEGRIQDEAIKIDGKDVELSQIGSLSPNTTTNQMELTLLNGTTRKLAMQDIPKLKVDLGGFSATVEPSSVTKVVLDAEDSDPKISYMFIVKSGGKEICRSSGDDMEKASNISSDEGGNRLGANSSKSSSQVFKGGSKTIPLPGTVTDAVLARGGEHLLVVLGVEKKLAVINIAMGSIEKILPLASDDVLVAGTMNHILLLDRKKNVIERYAIDNFTRQLAVKTPVSGVVKSMVTGCASNGPILFHRADGTDALANATFAVVDLMKLKELPVSAKGSSGHYTSYRDAAHLRASSNGRVFGMWATSHSPTGLQSMVLTDSALLCKYEHDSVGHVVPSSDGSNIFTGAGIFTTGLKRVGNGVRGGNSPFVPTSHPRFVIGLNSLMDSSQNPVAGNIHEVGTDVPLFQLPNLQLGTMGNNQEHWIRHDFTIDKRIYFNLDSHALVTIPFTNDGVIIQEFDLRKELKSSSLDYFFVSSTPNRICTPGKSYAYQIEVESNRKKFKFEVASGPEKMTVSPKGKVTWNVPKDFKEESVDVIISISDGDSLQTYDSFTIYNTNVVGKSK